jgi:cbb3-type cytochrome oxidase subunit 3
MDENNPIKNPEKKSDPDKEDARDSVAVNLFVFCTVFLTLAILTIVSVIVFCAAIYCHYWAECKAYNAHESRHLIS